MRKANQARRGKTGTALVEAAHAIERAAHVLFAYYTTTRPPAATRRRVIPGALTLGLACQSPAARRRLVQALDTTMALSRIAAVAASPPADPDRLAAEHLALRDQLLGVDAEHVVSSELETAPTGGRPGLPGTREIGAAIHALIGAGVTEADALAQAVRQIGNVWERRAFPLPSQVSADRRDAAQRDGATRYRALPDAKTLARRVRRWYRESAPK